MGKIVMLAPGEHIREYAEKLKTTLEDPSSFEIQVVHMEQAVAAARKLNPGETDVVIARGDTARLLKNSQLPFPVIDIGITEESIAKSIILAKEQTDMEDPLIALIGMESLVERLKAFFSILRSRITFYACSDQESIHKATQDAKAAGVDVVIGGALVCRVAEEYGIKTVLITTTYIL